MAERSCRYCGDTFAYQVKPGRPPAYCKRSHRQRHYEMGLRAIPAETRRRFLDQYGNACYLCDVPLDIHTMTVDHVRPLSQGGPDSIDNLRPCCVTCNLEKAARLVVELVDSWAPSGAGVRLSA